MKLVAALCADFDRNPLGGPSRLLDPLAGRRIIDHTLDRFVQVGGADEHWMIVDPSQTAPAAAAIAAAGARIRIAAIPRVSTRRRLLETTRKYNLESWRGGPMNSTWFDEYVDPGVIANFLQSTEADAAFICEAHQAALDPALVSAQIAAARARIDVAMIFSPAPPGLGGIVLAKPAVDTLISHNLTVGVLLTYRPEFPNTDPLIHQTCLHVDPDIAATAARFCADTRRSIERLGALFEKCGESAGAAALCQAHAELLDGRVEPLPREIELELTTETRAPTSRFRPPLAAGQSRQLTDRAALAQRLAELATYDDARLTIVGHGDPLLHPHFAEIARLIATAGIYGVTLVTPLQALSDEAFAAITSGAFDFLEVPIDATSPETYAALHGLDAYAQVVANIDRIEQYRRDAREPRPIIIPRFTRCHANFAEMDGFYDAWIQRAGSAIVRGFNDYGGALPADTLLCAEPPVRRPCSRLWSRMTLLADGRAVRCAQDFGASTPIGDWRTTSVADLWRGAALSEIRTAHRTAMRDGRSPGLPVMQAAHSLCTACREWFRP